MERPVWAEINLTAVANNVKLLRRHINNEARLMAVVKANGYGHGAAPVAGAALDNGADSLAVALLSEAIALRKEGFGVPILVLGYTPRDGAGEAVDWGISQTVYSIEQAEYLSAEAQRKGKIAKVHIKLDTGMGRIGFVPGRNTIRSINTIARLPRLEIEGIYSHFAKADDSDKSYTIRQLEIFLETIAALKKMGLEIPLKHIANSAAAIDCPEAHLNLVRAGISIYGLYPSPAQRGKIEFSPALSWKALVSHVKYVPEGTSISYGCTYTTKSPALIASLPLGYADGLSRSLSNKGQMLVNGRRVPIVGRVCMDQTMLDVTGAGEVEVNDEAVIIGRQGGENISADEMADWLKTINYEIVCMISGRVPRRYVKK